MSLTSGMRLGPYQVVSSIGAGGMGEVYRARDTRLDRDVAINVLPESVAHDADRVARFVREAKTLAALSHPNIAGIYGIEDAALVMELVEGDDLSQRLARGPIPLDDALPIARQIAEALEAAHDLGIVHRVGNRTDGDRNPGGVCARDSRLAHRSGRRAPRLTAGAL